MTRKKVKLAWIMNANSRAKSLKNRMSGLVKKVKELTILCDVKACMIIFSPNEVEPMVWPSFEAARDLLNGFFALPDVEKTKKEMNLQLYLEEKTKKVEQLMKSCKISIENAIDQLIMQLYRDRKLANLDLSEIYELVCLSRNKIMLCRKRLGLMENPLIRDQPMNIIEAESEEVRTTRNDVFIGSGMIDEKFGMTDEVVKKISIDNLRENQSHYLIDQWLFPYPKPPQPIIDQQTEMEMEYYNENPNPRSYLLCQGSNSNGNPNVEMEPIRPREITFHGLVGSVSQPLQYHHINSSGDVGTGNGLCQEPPSNGTNVDEGNADAVSFNNNRV